MEKCNPFSSTLRSKLSLMYALDLCVPTSCACCCVTCFNTYEQLRAQHTAKGPRANVQPLDPKQEGAPTTRHMRRCLLPSCNRCVPFKLYGKVRALASKMRACALAACFFCISGIFFLSSCVSLSLSHTLSLSFPTPYSPPPTHIYHALSLFLSRALSRAHSRPLSRERRKRKNATLYRTRARARARVRSHIFSPSLSCSLSLPPPPTTLVFSPRSLSNTPLPFRPPSSPPSPPRSPVFSQRNHVRVCDLDGNHQF